MNFQEIEQYMETGAWNCRYSLDRFIEQIENWCNGIDTDVKLDMNPDFQRGHVWTEKQQVAFVESILRGGAKNARIIYLNHPNWMRENSKTYSEFVCVDGLQRYTAIKKFIKNDLKVLGYYYEEFGGRLRMMHDMYINVNDLPTRKDVLQWYIEFNSGGTVHTDEEIERVKKLLELESK